MFNDGKIILKFSSKISLKVTGRKGNIVKCPPNLMHWHGASPEIGMMQMYILPKTEKGIVTWLHKVTDNEYNEVNDK